MKGTLSERGIQTANHAIATGGLKYRFHWLLARHYWTIPSPVENWSEGNFNAREVAHHYAKEHGANV